jgi:S-adenosylmethionine hydrolase
VPNSIITLTTDFGEESPYVAAMKGVILGINPAARILDLSHQIPPQDLRHAAFFLSNAIPWFPSEVIHVIVVDPGVGTERALLYVNVDGHQLLVPDNGCWTELACAVPDKRVVLRLANPTFWRHPVSATFHGRDILAPVAAHLSLGIEPGQLGPPVQDWVRLAISPPVCEGDVWSGEIVFIDHFGNLITNIPRDAFQKMASPKLLVKIGDEKVRPVWVRSYANVPAGTLIALISSSDTFEVAVSMGDAAARLGVRAGSGIRVVIEP